MTSTTPLRMVIGAGGTGGHIYPGLATADAVRALVPDADISFSGTDRGLETTLVPAGGYPLRTVPMTPLARTRDCNLALFPLHLVRSVRLAMRQLREDRVDVVLGMGGYPSIPVVLAARLAGIPCLVHESNAVPGRANLLAALMTPHVATGFDPAHASWCRRGAFPSGGREVRHLGIPLPSAVASADRRRDREEARAHFGVHAGQRFVIVSGGSQGAESLNRASFDLATRWADRDDVRLLVKARAGQTDEARRRLRATGGDRVADVVSYIDRMDLAYVAADAAVTRSGSASVAELQHLGVPAVLVPYPHAPGDHQTHNARELVDTGQARLVADEHLTVDSLERALDDLASSPAPAPSPRHVGAATGLAAWAVDLARAGRVRRGRVPWADSPARWPSTTAATPSASRLHASSAPPSSPSTTTTPARKDHP
ncbi:UDP-N-acetylglucosamine--N-acetylmuramyl-(pentapeptide) pyrophosphoryl-undecaprenol N-acetylglucosamine transferase [Frigoribacterium sp. R86507]|uniref:UDP-N-acetylglucosamine--N-acetylmuramyl- (pentapeptide) pyrophosphoryl-undecaprenol N-acetylglucosamine transferase n=1 Tax=Frigoribacterium sp. R86507 TaxID=3093850 RepID=UPI0037CBAA60